MTAILTDADREAIRFPTGERLPVEDDEALYAAVEQIVREKIAGAIDDFADEIDRGPRVPLPPRVYSALARERAAEIRGQS